MASSSSVVKVGDKFPSGITLYESTPDGAVHLDELIKGKKVLFFGLPGAFTPGCSKTHLPGYVAAADSLHSKGVNEIVCVSVNDPFVMHAWGESQNATGKVRCLADTNADLSKALGVAFHLGVLGGLRSKRYSMLVEDGIITQFNLEPESAPTGLTCSLAAAIKI